MTLHKPPPEREALATATSPPRGCTLSLFSSVPDGAGKPRLTEVGWDAARGWQGAGERPAERRGFPGPGRAGAGAGLGGGFPPNGRPAEARGWARAAAPVGGAGGGGASLCLSAVFWGENFVLPRKSQSLCEAFSPGTTVQPLILGPCACFYLISPPKEGL